MSHFKRLTPEGTRDVLFRTAQTEHAIAAKLRNHYYQFGYREVRTPGIEFYDVFGGTDKYFPQESMYKTTDHRGRLIVMRPDATIPIARLVCTKLRNLALPMRLTYDETIYRSGQSLNGISHEMHQSGVELIGTKDEKSDIEMLVLASQSLTLLNCSEFRLELGHVGIVNYLLDQLSVADEIKIEISEALENKNYSLLRDALEEHQDMPAAKLLLQLPRLFGTREVFKKARSLFAPVASNCLDIIDQIELRYNALANIISQDNIMVDFSLAHQADYYSGLLFRGYVGGIGVAVLSGGRYDKLLNDFGLDVPAIGFGVRVDLLAQVLSDYEEESVSLSRLLYATSDDFSAALQAREELKGTVIMSMATTLEEARQEAKDLGAKFILVYQNGNILEEEVSHA